MKLNVNDKRILIVGSLPYFKDSQSRAFDSYFKNFKKENLVQIYSSTRVPKKGHCSSFFQITDLQMLKRRFGKKNKIGKIYFDAELEDQDDNANLVNGKSKLYRIGKRKTPLIYLLRKHLWKQKYWLTKELDSFVDNFKPEVVFLAWSDDFYTLRIAIHFAKKYNLPIISCIGDDYLFNDRFSLNPFYYIYRCQYLKLSKSILEDRNNREIYISNKIADFYNSKFNKCGVPVYVGIDENEISKPCYKWENKKLCYFGNLEHKRLESILNFVHISNKLCLGISVDIYGRCSNKQLKKINKIDNVNYKGFVNYNDVINTIKKYEGTIVCETFDSKSEIKNVRFSLSTKVADSLASGVLVFALGNKECGAIDFLAANHCSVVINDLNNIAEEFDKLNSQSYLAKLESNATRTIEKYFIKKNSLNTFNEVVESCYETK